MLGSLIISSLARVRVKVPRLDLKPVQPVKTEMKRAKVEIKKARSPVRAYINRKAPISAAKSTIERTTKVVPKKQRPKSAVPLVARPKKVKTKQGPPQNSASRALTKK